MNSHLKSLLILSLSVVPFVGCGKSEPPRVLKANPEEQKKLDEQHAEIVKNGGKAPTAKAGGPAGHGAPGK